MPQNWKTYKVEDVCLDIIDCVNKTAPSTTKNTGFRMIRTSNIKSGRLDLTNVKYVTKEVFNKWVRRGKPIKGDVLLTREAPVGEVAILREEEDVFLGQRIVMYRTNPEICNNHFLYYSMLASDIQSQLQALGMGSTIEHIRVPDSKAFRVNLPPLPEQQAIAEILSSLDDKIELNIQMNKTLEEMAMTLYKHWFVDFEFPVNSPPPEGSAQQGVVNSPPPEGWISSKMKDGVVNSPPQEESPQGEVVYNHPAFQAPLQRRGKDSAEEAPLQRRGKDSAEEAPLQRRGRDNAEEASLQGKGRDSEEGGRSTANYMSLPYNPALKERAKALRKAGNLAEVLFWQQVHRKKFLGLDFDRQKIIGNYIVDFYCANVQVVVEVDGSSHDGKEEYDAARDAYLEGLGLTVIHITDEAVKKDLEETMEELKNHPAFQGVVNSPPQEEYPQGEVVYNHPAFQAPLQRRGSVGGYKSSGGKFIDSPLGPIPEGWEVKRLSEFVELTMGQSPKSEFYNDNQEGLPFHQGVSDYGIRFPKDETYSTSGKRQALEGDILFSVRAPVGRLNIAKNRIILGRGLAAMRMEDHNNFLFYAMKNKFSSEDIIGSGTVFNSVNKTDLQNLEFVIPPLCELNNFKEIVEPIDKAYSNNSIEIQTLTALRDTLLPKLISGEVSVKEVEQTVAEVL